MLTALVRDLGIDNVVFTGPVTQTVLNALYERADIFLCMSEHEGFCIPLLESMVHSVPVLAYSAGAVPETLDGAGILFAEKNFEMIAEMLGRVVKDGPLRFGVIARQIDRLERYRTVNLESQLQEHLAPLLTRREPASESTGGRL